MVCNVRLSQEFQRVFGATPDTESSAPGRVNLLGEHTDYNDGYVLPTAIPQRTWVALRANGGTEHVVHALSLSQTSRFSRAQPPVERFATYVFGCFETLRDWGADIPYCDVLVDSDVPIGVGLSSSAALEVATLRAARDLLSLHALDDVTIAQLAQRAEIEFAGVRCGIMDQMASSLADTGRMLFLDTRTLDRALLPLPAQARILVLDSGVSRSLTDTAYNQRRAECEEAARLLDVRALRDVTELGMLDALPELLRRRARHVVTENMRVLQARGSDDSASVSAEEFGRLMNASHDSLRDDFEVSVRELDILVALLQAHESVYGARLTGAGFGGACVALCRDDPTLIAQDILPDYNRDGRQGRVLVPASAHVLSATCR